MKASRARPSLHPGLCPACHGAGVQPAQAFSIVAGTCPGCHGLGVTA